VKSVELERVPSIRHYQCSAFIWARHFALVLQVPCYNVWPGEGVLLVPEGGVGLRHWTVVLEGLEDVAAVSGRIREAGVAIEERGCGLR
jgi:hypothetical protein